MRIISGKLGGRRIAPPAKMPHTRPTTDIAKEGLFNIISNNLDITQLRTLDLFGGTGCISYELASRGAIEGILVEKDPAMYQFIQKTLADLQLDNFSVIKSEVFKYMESCRQQFDFIFAGPPYALTTIDKLPVKVREHNLLAPNGWFVLEHTPRNDYKGYPLFVQSRNYGTTVFSFFINR